jgi:hypothetical protein
VRVSACGISCIGRTADGRKGAGLETGGRAGGWGTVLARGLFLLFLLLEWDMRPFLLLLLVLLLSLVFQCFSAGRLRCARAGGYGGYPQKYICVFLW